MGTVEPLFHDRKQAGQQLGNFLKGESFRNPVILALPRGGVIVADEVAKTLNATVDVVVARKIGAPGHPEYGVGALSEDSEPFFRPSVEDYLNPDSPFVNEIVENEKLELKRRIELYRGGHSLPDMKGRTVIVVDDGLATGVTAVAAAKYLHSLHPEKLVLAVPVAPQNISADVTHHYDDIICLHSLQNLRGVGLWYQDFSQVEDNEVLSILKKYH